MALLEIKTSNKNVLHSNKLSNFLIRPYNAIGFTINELKSSVLDS